MKIIPLSLIALSFCVSCQKDGKPSEKIDAKASDSMAAVVAADYETSLRNMTATPQNPQVPVTVNPTASQPTKAGTNPPHGQPGHRCDIAVGAPLNSKPVTPANTATAATNPNSISFPNAQNQNQPANSSQASTSSATITPMETPKKAESTAPGWQGKPNPAHGTEGHRCDIPVGVTLP